MEKLHLNICSKLLINGPIIEFFSPTPEEVVSPHEPDLAAISAETDTSASFHFLRGQKETKNNVVSWTPQEEAVSEKLLQLEQTR